MDPSAAKFVTPPAGEMKTDLRPRDQESEMKLPMLALAAALTLGGFAATPAAAQPGRHDGNNRTMVRTTHTVVMHRRTNWQQNANRGRHQGWRNHHRTCTTTWRHHQRVVTCRSW
jgi:hypothetical protein